MAARHSRSKDPRPARPQAGRTSNQADHTTFEARTEVLNEIQRLAGNRATTDLVQRRASRTKSTYEKLVDKSRSNWIGNVDEGACLRLVARLSASERQRAAADSALLGRLAGAFDSREMISLLGQLPLSLAAKVYWMHRADEIDQLPSTVATAWVAAAPAHEVRQILARRDLFGMIIRRIPPLPSYALRTSFAALDVVDLYGSSVMAAKWLGRSSGPIVVREITQPGVSPAQTRAAVRQMMAAGVWRRVVGRLPAGTAMDGPTRKALRLIVAADPPQSTVLFSKRFGKELQGPWDFKTVGLVWQQLEGLPDQDVTQNNVLKAFKAISKTGAFWAGGDTVQIGTDYRDPTSGSRARLPHTVRHEIGHAVHDLLASTVNAWLRSGVKFWYLPGGRSGVRRVINEFGGWPATYQDRTGAAVKFTSSHRRVIEDMLVKHGNEGKWVAKTTLPGAPNRALGAPPKPDKAEMKRLLWSAMPADLRKCFDGSKDRWYKNYATHPRGTTGFIFWNHWYGRPYYFSPTAKQAIAATGDTYSAMSEKEFFANCYAEYFGDPDPAKWGGSLNADVQAFFLTHIANREPYQYTTGAGAGSSLPPSPGQVPEP